MADAWSALTVFVLLCLSASLGWYVRPRLPETHRARETVEVMQLIIGMLVTFAALVLGLLTASVKAGYDAASHDRQEYALQLAQLDQCLRNYGPETDPAREDLRSYTAAVIASTWPYEKRPVGVHYPDTSHMPLVGAVPVLAALMNRAGLSIEELQPSDGAHRRIQRDCLARFHDVLTARAAVIEDVRGSISAPFYRILVAWLMVIFAAFGLAAPRNMLLLLAIVLCAISLSSAVFVIADLSRPYGGLFVIPSTDMRAALASMTRP